MDLSGLKQFYGMRRDKQTEKRRVALRQDLFHVFRKHTEWGVTYGDIVSEIAYALSSITVVGERVCMCWDTAPSPVSDGVGHDLLKLTEDVAQYQPVGMPRPIPDGATECYAELARVCSILKEWLPEDVSCIELKYPDGAPKIEGARKSQYKALRKMRVLRVLNRWPWNGVGLDFLE